MRILYIFPHPDDESFGPAALMAKQRREGHEVFLLTLTRGGATKRRFDLGKSIAEMGELRYSEMLDVAATLDLSGMTVLNLPDSGLKKMDPREIERVVAEHIKEIDPHIVVTYAVHGISGFHDHLVCHAVVKRVFVELKGTLQNLKRLALYTITEESAAKSTHFHLSGSKPEELGCISEFKEEDRQKGLAALDCYVTYKETIEASGIKQHIQSPFVFELFQERHEAPLNDITEFSV